MKNLYISALCLISTCFAFGQNGQIMNGGFESWSSQSLYDTPTDWESANTNEFRGVPTVVKSTDAQDGSFSAELKVLKVGEDTLTGYVFHGTVGESGPEGGIPYTALFDNVRVRYKCDLATNDSLFMIMIRLSSGIPVDMASKSVAFGTVSTWTTANIAVTSMAQDELFIGFVIGDPMNESASATPNSWARIDNVQLTAAGVPTTAVPNPSFETWENISTEVPDNWFTMNPMFAGNGITFVTKTSSTNSGSYAVELTTQTIMNDTIQGFLSMGPINMFGMNPFVPAPYNATPTIFSGAYKYAPVNSDIAAIQITFLSGGSPIGVISENFNSVQSTFSTFTSTVTLAGTPDSIIFYAYSGENPGSVLTLDDLQFTGGDVSLNEIDFSSFKVHPNPASGVVYIGSDKNEVFNYQLVDIYGNSVINATNVMGVQKVSLDRLAAGTYFVRITANGNSMTEKLIIK